MNDFDEYVLSRQMEGDEPPQCEERKECPRGVGHRCLHDDGHSGACVFCTCKDCREQKERQ